MQPGFFDLDNRHIKLNERDPLIQLNQLIDWEDFRPSLEKIREKPRKSQAGRKPYDVVLLFKMLNSETVMRRMLKSSEARRQSVLIRIRPYSVNQ